MREIVDADRDRRSIADLDLEDFLRGIEPAGREPALSRRAVLRLRSRLRLALYLVGGVLAAVLLLGRFGIDALTFFALFALWVFLGISACCRVER